MSDVNGYSAMYLITSSALSLVIYLFHWFLLKLHLIVYIKSLHIKYYHLVTQRGDRTNSSSILFRYWNRWHQAWTKKVWKRSLLMQRGVEVAPMQVQKRLERARRGSQLGDCVLRAGLGWEFPGTSRQSSLGAWISFPLAQDIELQSLLSDFTRSETREGHIKNGVRIH